MDHRSPECTHEKIVKMFPVRVLGAGGGRKRTEVLSGMIVWNILVLILLVLAVCVQGQGGAAPSDTSPNLALRRLPREESGEKGSPDVSTISSTKLAVNPTPPPQSSQDSDSGEPQNSQTTPKSDLERKGEGEGETKQGGKEGDGDTQINPENKSANTNTTIKEGSGSGLPPSHPSMSTEAVLRGFYVFVGIGAIILIYIVIKLTRLRKRRAPGKYRVLSHTDDQEMFPLAAGDGEDEEIFNAAHHQPRK